MLVQGLASSTASAVAAQVLFEHGKLKVAAAIVLRSDAPLATASSLASARPPRGTMAGTAASSSKSASKSALCACQTCGSQFGIDSVLCRRAV